MIFLFGYVRPQKSELLIREFEQYKGVYCSLCRQLGKRYGAAARLALNFDCTFYAMLLLSRNQSCAGFQIGRCVVNPVKKCTYCNAGEKEFAAAAALTVIMTYYKIRDDISDSKFLGKLRGYLLLPLAFNARKKAARDFPQIDSIVSKAIIQQNKTEASQNFGIDSCSEPTANMLGEVFSNTDGLDDGSAEKRIFQQIGYFLGRWVYLIDAADDIEKDIKTNSFNPFVALYKLSKNSTAEDFSGAKENINQMLNLTLSQLIAAFHLVNIEHFGSILDNIICKGLPEMQKEILFKKEIGNVRSL
jgi:hypothetical protein